MPLFIDLSRKGIDCYLVEMPFNLAFFSIDSADDIIDNSNYTHYYMAGHSLGGIMASTYVNETNNKIDGLIYLSSYSSVGINVPVLSIRGTNDDVINLKSYNESRLLFKNNFTEILINGGNHAQFGYYGNQSGDGQANITAESQQDQSVEAIITFIKDNNYII